MFGRLLTSAVVVTVAALHSSVAPKAQERMQLGAPGLSPGVEFRDLAGDRVFFGDGSADLGSRARAALAVQAAWLVRNPAAPVIVEGHADDSGDSEQNLTVSRQRAESVRQRLIELGVAPQRIRTVAYGKLRLLADCPDSFCAAQNRRAVTVIGRMEVPVPVAPSTSGATTGDGRMERSDLGSPRPARRLF